MPMLHSKLMPMCGAGISCRQIFRPLVKNCSVHDLPMRHSHSRDALSRVGWPQSDLESCRTMLTMGPRMLRSSGHPRRGDIAAGRGTGHWRCRHHLICNFNVLHWPFVDFCTPRLRLQMPSANEERLVVLFRRKSLIGTRRPCRSTSMHPPHPSRLRALARGCALPQEGS